MWYVVCDREDVNKDDLEETIWTVSEDPNESGWWTDCGCPSYGLNYKKAKYLADCANYVEEKVGIDL